MPYGILKVDTITFTAGGVDTSVSISGLVQNPTFTGNITSTGTISGNIIQGSTTVSGATVTGTAGQFGTLTGNTAGFTTITGTTITGTTANLVTVSGTTVTGNAGSFTTVTGGVATITSGVFAAGTEALPSISFSSDSNTGIFSPGADQVAISTNGTGRLFIDSSGRVGINANSPSSYYANNLVIGTASEGGLTLANNATTGANYIMFADGTTGNERFRGQIFYDHTNDAMAFATAAQEKLRITSAGLVGVGTSSISRQLTVSATTIPLRLETSDSNMAIEFVSNAGTRRNWLIGAQYNVNGGFEITPGTANGNTTFSTPALVIDSSSRVGIGVSSPSELLHLGSGGKIRLNRADNATGSTINDGGSNNGIIFNSLNNDGFTFQNGGTTVFKIDTAPNGSRVGIGTTAPISTIEITGTGECMRIQSTTAGSNYITHKHNSSGDIAYIGAAGGGALGSGTNTDYAIRANQGALLFATNGNNERARIDSSGRLLLGTSSSVQVYQGATAFNSEIQVAGSSASLTIARSVGSGNLFLARNQTVNNGSPLGVISFNGGDGTNLIQAAQISAEVDATPGTNDMPGRLVFSTTADGAASPTERARITNGGFFKASNAGSYRNANDVYHEFWSDKTNTAFILTATNGSFNSEVQYVNVHRAATAAYSFLGCNSGNDADREFTLRGDGNAFADGTWSGGGADYAEYFEWSDANLDEEDRRGISVVLDGEKIREAVAGEDPIGVISGNPSVVGDAAWNKWSGKYIRDEFGSYLLDENGERQLNSAYDPDQEYIPREQRPEWDCVGLMGKLRIRKGQVTGSRWIKMRDISDSVEEWLVR